MNILIASSVCSDAITQLRKQHDVRLAVNAAEDELRSAVVDRDVLVFRSGVQITADVMARAPQLKLLIRAGSGLDNLDVDYARQRGIKLIRIPGPGAQAVSELAFGLMLALARQILVADKELRSGHWTKHIRTGYVLRGKTLGIVGAGNIGSRLGEMGSAWGMTAVGCVEHPCPAVAESLRAKGIRLTTFEEVLTESDFVSVHCPLKASTRKLIGKQALALMKPTAFLINMARGGIVDEQALLHALLHEGKPAGAALDVHEQEGERKVSPLASLPNVVLTPHIGATTVDTQREIGERILAAVESFHPDACHGAIGADPGLNETRIAAYDGGGNHE